MNEEQEQPQPQPQQEEASQNQPLGTQQQANTGPPQAGPATKPLSRGVVIFLRFLVIGGGMFIVFIIGLGVTFSACFTIKGPPPPQCGPVSFVSLILMPGGVLFFLIPLAKKIK